MSVYSNGSEIPMGFGMALMKNKKAMAYFSSLTIEAQQRIIDHTHTVQSKEEMQHYVDSLVQ